MIESSDIVLPFVFSPIHLEAPTLEAPTSPFHAKEVAEAPSFENNHLVIQYGNLSEAAARWVHQGANQLGFQGTCGLASIAGCIRGLGAGVSEETVVEFAAKQGLCDVTGDPEACGGTTFSTIVEIFRDCGIPAHATFISDIQTVADSVRSGQGVIVGLNAGVLWSEEEAGSITSEQIATLTGDGTANHAVEVVGVDIDPATGTPTGFFINDTGVPNGAAHFVSAATFAKAMVGGGAMVVTDLTPANTVRMPS